MKRTMRIGVYIGSILVLVYLALGTLYHSHAETCSQMQVRFGRVTDSGKTPEVLSWTMDTAFWPLFLIGDRVNGVGIYDCKLEQEATDKPANIPLNWKVFRNQLGFSFNYPSMLELGQNSKQATLTHTIPYKNSGSCDMRGGSGTYDTLEDFHVSFELQNEIVKPSYVDGELEAGILKGVLAYEGAEGCGDYKYYFPVAGGRTLVVTRASVQPLSSVVTPEIRNKLLTVPGVISQEESDNLFRQVLASLVFTDHVTLEKIGITNIAPGQKLQQGQLFTVHWHDDASKAKVALEVVDTARLADGASVSKVVQIDNIPNTGSYVWQVPYTLNGEYKLGITDADGFWGWSEKFSVVPVANPNPKLWSKSKPPQFSDFSVTAIYTGTPAAVDLTSNADAPNFKNNLQLAAKTGPNFAGHYTVAEWGCGSNCQNHMLIDAKNGKVYGLSEDAVSECGVEYRLNSSLYIADQEDCTKGSVTATLPTRYYIWKDSKLILIYQSFH